MNSVEIREEPHYKIPISEFKGWDEVSGEKYLCGLYKYEKDCKYPLRKCKNCFVYNGFRGGGKI